MDTNGTITEKLAKLKAELVSLRQQDVKLMKQLIGINEMIQSMSHRDRGCISKPITRTFITSQNGQKGCIGVNVFPAEALDNVDTPLIRIQSVPNYYRAQDISCSSAEELSVSSSIDDCSSSISSGDHDHTCLSPILSPLLSVKHPKQVRHLSDSLNKHSDDSAFDVDDMDYEEILIRNIQLWKDGHVNDIDSVFE